MRTLSFLCLAISAAALTGGCVDDVDPGVMEGDEAAVLTPATRAAKRAEMKCYVRAANLAYENGGPIAGCASWTYRPTISNAVVKVWTRVVNKTTSQMLIAFAGTRFTNPGDWLRDFQSQATRPFQSALRANTFYPTEVGKGWHSRWRNQAGSNNGALRNAILNLMHGDNPNQRIELVVVGHSLGAATAIVAGYDIARTMQAFNVRKRGTFVWAFNPPRPGGHDFRNAYQDALFNNGGAQLFLRQFTRTGDAVQSVPVRQAHPVWNTAPNARTVGAGNYPDAELRYCPMYNAPRHSVSPIANHSLAAWIGTIDAIPDSHLDCMWASP